MKEIDLGYKYGSGEVCCGEPDSEDKVHYPTLHINKMKATDGKDVDDEFYAKVKLRKRSISKDDDGYSCSYDVLSMAPLPDKKEVKEFGEMLDEAMED